ncbi:putative glycosyltransferase [Drosera capensis]
MVKNGEITSCLSPLPSPATKADLFGFVWYLLKLWRLACSCAMITKDPRVVYQPTDLWLRVPMLMAKWNNIAVNYIGRRSIKDPYERCRKSMRNKKPYTRSSSSLLYTHKSKTMLKKMGSKRSSHTPSRFSLCTTLCFIGDLRTADFAWNRLTFDEILPPRATMKIAVFSRKWPTSSVPGGMERHAYTLHTATAARGHRVHIFTSPYPNCEASVRARPVKYPLIHCHEGHQGQWRYNKAWEQFQEENARERFDVVHTESVALPHWLAMNVSNLVVSWHGIALESLQSSIYQDLIRLPNEPMSPEFKKSIYGVVPKVLQEIRFFHRYAHHVAISDSCGQMLRDVYQIPRTRVHVIANGVDDGDFKEDLSLRAEFWTKVGIPKNARIVLGIAGRLVKDKGHPLLFAAFSKLIKKHNDVFLVIAGTGPWEGRYRELGPQALVLGSMNPSELRGFYNGIDIFVNPTLRPQGLDLTLMESMMAGTPVMASRYPSIKGTILVEEEFGFMFAPNVDSLLEAFEVALKEGPERLAQRGQAGKAYAHSMFTARKMTLAYERLFLCVKNESFCHYT